MKHCTCPTSSSLTLIVKAIDAVDGGTLVVAPQEEEVLRVLDFVSQQKAYSLQGLFASVHIVPKEQIVALRREPTILKEPQEIIVLTMDITCGVNATELLLEIDINNKN